MKIRTGHVSNSSSSSFVIAKSALTPGQLKALRIHSHYAKTHFLEEHFFPEPWSIAETDHVIRGSTSMDNFDMRKFLTLIGVQDEDVDFDDGDFR
jgi:hypothetical protein